MLAVEFILVFGMLCGVKQSALNKLLVRMLFSCFLLHKSMPELYLYALHMC